MRAPFFIAGLMAAIALSIVVTHAATDHVRIMVERAKELELSLSDEQKAKLFVPFDDAARIGWSFFPGERKGLTLYDMSLEQRELARHVFAAALSDRGMRKVENIESLEDVLHALSPNDTSRDREKYTLAIFGTPGTEKPWGLRWEGHHLSLNWTVADGKLIASTPQFLGTNPAEVLEGPRKGLRVLSVEEDLARSLVKSLDEKQRTTGILSDTAPADIITRMEREVSMLEDKGIAYAEMTPAQQGMLNALIDEYASVQAPELARERVERLKAAGMEKIRFAWMGGLEKGEGHYYRVQGPTFIIEYDNTQNNANHVHTVWRDFKNDFGRDLLLEHYKAAANASQPDGHVH